jgi:hypothetical protein
MFNSVSGTLHIEGAGIALDVNLDKSNFQNGVTLGELPDAVAARVKKCLELLSAEADKSIAKEKARADKAEEKLAKLVAPIQQAKEEEPKKKEALPKRTAELVSDDNPSAPIRRR